MDEPADNLRLNDRQRTRLLQLGLGPDRPAFPPDGDEQRGDLLCDMLRFPFLTQPLEQGTSLADGMPFSVLRAVAGPPLRELLLDPTIDLSTLRKIKEYAKSLGNDAGSDVDKDVFLTIYFAAIAAAVVLHEERITEHVDHDLRGFFLFFAAAPWMPTALADLFSRAARTVSGLPGED